MDLPSGWLACGAVDMVLSHMIRRAGGMRGRQGLRVHMGGQIRNSLYRWKPGGLLPVPEVSRWWLVFALRHCQHLDVSGLMDVSP
jgi:hypothetical protein